MKGQGLAGGHHAAARASLHGLAHAPEVAQAILDLVLGQRPPVLFAECADWLLLGLALPLFPEVPKGFDQLGSAEVLGQNRAAKVLDRREDKASGQLHGDPDKEAAGNTPRGFVLGAAGDPDGGVATVAAPPVVAALLGVRIEKADKLVHGEWAERFSLKADIGVGLEISEL